jgi:hypothetical protein
MMVCDKKELLSRAKFIASNSRGRSHSGIFTSN